MRQLRHPWLPPRPRSSEPPQPRSRRRLRHLSNCSFGPSSLELRSRTLRSVFVCTLCTAGHSDTGCPNLYLCIGDLDGGGDHRHRRGRAGVGGRCAGLTPGSGAAVSGGPSGGLLKARVGAVESRLEAELGQADEDRYQMKDELDRMKGELERMGGRLDRCEAGAAESGRGLVAAMKSDSGLPTVEPASLEEPHEASGPWQPQTANETTKALVFTAAGPEIESDSGRPWVNLGGNIISLIPPPTHTPAPKGSGGEKAVRDHAEQENTAQQQDCEQRVAAIEAKVTTIETELQEQDVAGLVKNETAAFAAHMRGLETHRRLQQEEQCQGEAMQAMLAACCPTGGGGGQHRRQLQGGCSGFPASCSAECADLSCSTTRPVRA